MIALFNAQIIIGNHDIISAYYGADNCAGWQLNFIDGASHHARCGFITVSDSFNGFSDAATQLGHTNNICFTNVAQQRGNRCLLR